MAHGGKMTLTATAAGLQPATVTVETSAAAVVGGAVLGDNAGAVVTIVDNEASNAPSGSMDVAFAGGIGANGTIRDVELMPNGKIIVAGNFSNFNNGPVGRLIRLKPDGGVDRVFSIGTGFNEAVNVVKLHQGECFKL